MTYAIVRRFVIVVVPLAILACGSTDATNGGAGGIGGMGGVVGGAGAGGAGGVGGFRQIASEDATSAEECAFLGIGGSDLITCDYNTVEFSSSLDASTLDVEVTTSNGDVLTPWQPTSSPEECPTRQFHGSFELPDDNPVLQLVLDAVCDAAGFRIIGNTEDPRNSPSELDVLVTVDDEVVVATALEPAYSCVEITSDDWCWRGDPIVIEIAP